MLRNLSKVQRGDLSKLQIGDSGEEFATRFLQKRGYRILHRKFRSRFGEVDIVAQDKKAIVFVEVKTRKSHKYGRPEEAVGYYKLKHINRVANFYIQKYKLNNLEQRVEIVALEVGSDNKYIPKLIVVD